MRDLSPFLEDNVLPAFCVLYNTMLGWVAHTCTLTNREQERSISGLSDQLASSTQ